MKQTTVDLIQDQIPVVPGGNGHALTDLLRDLAPDPEAWMVREERSNDPVSAVPLAVVYLLAKRCIHRIRTRMERADRESECEYDLLAIGLRAHCRCAVTRKLLQASDGPEHAETVYRWRFLLDNATEDGRWLWIDARRLGDGSETLPKDQAEFARTLVDLISEGTGGRLTAEFGTRSVPTTES